METIVLVKKVIHECDVDEVTATITRGARDTVLTLDQDARIKVFQGQIILSSAEVEDLIAEWEKAKTH